MCVCVCVCVCMYVRYAYFLKHLSQYETGKLKHMDNNNKKQTDSITPTFVIRTEMTSRQFRIDSQRAMHLLQVVYMR
jgi:hypothetical protein